MSRRLRMESSGSIVHTNNGNLQNYYTNLEDMIDLYSEEAKGVAEKPHEEWVSDAGDNGRYLALSRSVCTCIIAKYSFYYFQQIYN